MITTIITIGYLVALLVVGFVFAKKVTTTNEYYIAGRNLSPWILGLSFFAAVGTAWGYIGGPGSGYAYGVPEFASFAGWIPGVAIVAFIFAPKIREKASQYNTNSFTGFVRDIHGGGYPLTYLTSIVVLGAYILFFVSCLKAVGVALSPVLGISYMQALLIGGIVIILYCIMGGLRAVVLTDIVGLVFMCITFGATVWLIQSQGGITGLSARIDAYDPELLHPSTGAPYGATMASIWIMFFVLYIFYQALPQFWHYYISLGSSSKKGAAIFTMLATVSVCMVPFLIFTGVAGNVLLPERLADADTVMPAIFQTFTNPTVFALFTVGVFTAVMTTFDGALLAITACVKEMFEPLFSRYNQNEAQRLKWGRVLMAVIWAIAMFWAATAPPALMVRYLVIGAIGLSSVIAGPTIFAVIKVGTKWGAFCAILVSVIVLAILVVRGLLGWIEQALVTAIASVAVYYIVSAIEWKVNPASKMTA